MENMRMSFSIFSGGRWVGRSFKLGVRRASAEYRWWRDLGIPKSFRNNSDQGRRI